MRISDWSSDVCSSDLPVDIDQRILAAGVLVDGERVADVWADGDVIDRQRRQFVERRLVQRPHQRLGDLVTGLGVDLARLLVDEVGGNVKAKDRKSTRLNSSH